MYQKLRRKVRLAQKAAMEAAEKFRLCGPKDFLKDHWGFPRVVHIENTNLCNAHCTICPREKLTRPKGVMDLELFDKIITEVAKYRQVKEVHLHGFGEPLLDKDLPQKVKRAKQLGINSTYIVSNGSLLTEELGRELIQAGLSRMKISFYGADKENYNAIHHKLDFDDVYGRVKRFLALREKLNAKNPFVYIQYNPLSGLEDQRDKFKQLWMPYINKDKGDLLMISGLHNWAGSRNYTELQKGNQERHCHWPFTVTQILWSGEVAVCVFDFNGEYIIGNCREQSLYDIWNGRNLEDLRGYWRQRRSMEHPLCRNCDEPEMKYQSKKLK